MNGFRPAGLRLLEVPGRVTPTAPAPRSLLVGLDLGQTTDPTALAVLEREVLVDAEGLLRKDPRGQDITRLDCLHLVRYPLGTSYPALVLAVVRLLADPRMQVHGRPRMAIDATGVGRPVVDLFLDAAPAADLIPVTITGGTQVVREAWNRTHAVSFKVPKVELVSTVQAGLQTGRLKVSPRLELAETLKAELVGFQVKVSHAGYESFNGREGIHDDMVLAVALAAWLGDRPAGKKIRVI